jgi:hypothetical protein
LEEALDLSLDSLLMMMTQRLCCNQTAQRIARRQHDLAEEWVVVLCTLFFWFRYLAQCFPASVPLKRGIGK